MAFISVALLSLVTRRTGNHHAHDNYPPLCIHLCTWVVCITCGSYHTMNAIWGPEGTSQKNYMHSESSMAESMDNSSVGSILRGFPHEHVYHIVQTNHNLQMSVTFQVQQILCKATTPKMIPSYPMVVDMNPRITILCAILPIIYCTLG